MDEDDDDARARGHSKPLLATPAAEEEEAVDEEVDDEVYAASEANDARIKGSNSVIEARRISAESARAFPDETPPRELSPSSIRAMREVLSAIM